MAVPAGYEVVVLIPPGYPAKEPVAPKRRAAREFIHFDKFQELAPEGFGTGVPPPSAYRK